MKKILMTLCCLWCGIWAWAQPKEAYVLYNAEGQRTDYGTMLRQLAQKDVVFVGEIHTCPIAHWIELELTRDLWAIHRDNFMLGAEMFERDDQLLLDEYLGGLISQNRFHVETKLWDNYSTDYAPLVEFAKANHVPFVATNVARRYANMVSKGGFEALDALSDEARQYVAPLPFDYKPNPYIQAFFGQMMGGMPGNHAKADKKPAAMKMNSAENLCKSQALKDVTMAYSIAQRIGKGKMLHINGSFHSTGYNGILPYLSDFKPGLTYGTVEVVRQDDVTQLDKASLGIADFIICVPKSMTSTRHE